MPFPRNLLCSKADGEGNLSPRWPKSPQSPKSPEFPESPKSSKSPTSPKSSKSPRFAKSPNYHIVTRKNNDGLHQCRGCDEVEDMIRLNMEQQQNGGAKRSWVPLHSNFKALDECAAKCHICRVFRQSLLLEEVTFAGLRDIYETKGQVTVRWQETTAADGATCNSLAVVIEDQPERPGVVNCSSRNEVAHLALHADGGSTAVIEQAKEWLNVCLNSHVGDCDNLRFSSEYPARLIEIHSRDSIQLRENQAGDYVALSYCWGAETTETERGKTTTKNLKDRCRHPFSTEGLPTTIRDALDIVLAMGHRYAWIDYLCINQTTFDDGDRMHIVYSNALFTLCASATTKATAKLLDQRKAWTYRTEPCRIGGQWLTTPDMSLNELRLRSPLAGRAWTLQEERLSPRMLYVSSSRIYWSCAKGTGVELKPAYEERTATLRRPVYSTTDRNADIPQSQEFLIACRLGEDKLYRFWADIVKSYASRDIGKKKDRLTALSGLAAKYLTANGPDEYLAGIWANNLPEGLAWKVDCPIAIRRIADPEAPKWPSWSWAVLPTETAIQTDAKSARSSFFQQIFDKNPGILTEDVEVEVAIKQGEQVKKLCVTGRTRALWKPSSRRADWSTVSRDVNGEEKFSFGTNPEQNMHAVDPASGRVLVYEGRKREVVGQLDFEHDVRRVQLGRVDLVALEIGETTSLLLEKSGDETHRRLGVAWDVRKDFFALVVAPEVLILQ